MLGQGSSEILFYIPMTYMQRLQQEHDHAEIDHRKIVGSAA
jgi:hypothetical protein